jgi:hypothetical protein
MGQPITGGSGCPAGTASAVLSPDGKNLSILFDQYQAQAGGPGGQRFDRKSCSIAIPVHVPQGFAVSILAIDYRGFNALPAGAQSAFNVEYFFAGSQGPGFTKSYYGPLNEDYLFHNDVVAQSVVWSACGADVNLRTETSIYVATDPQLDQAMATVDSADVSASVVYQLQWRSCGGGYPPLPNPGPAPGYPPPPAPQPTPFPGQPGGYTGNCRIDADPYNYGQYLVRDLYQDLIARAYSYQQAVQIAEEADAEGRCLGNAPAPNPYPPSPPPYPYPQPGPYPPYPAPNPYPPYPGNPYPPYPGTPGVPGAGPVSCQLIIPGYGTYYGSGSSPGQAQAAARDSCLHAVNNSRVCNAGTSACR